MIITIDRRRVWVTLCTAIVVLMARPALSQTDSLGSWRLSGQFLNLYTRSRTVIPAPQGFALDLSRARLKLEAQTQMRFGVEVQYDNELLVGSYVNTQQYALIEQRVMTSFDLQREYLRRDNVSARHNLYRAWASWSGASTDIRIGRQRIPLGTGYFWSPMDLLNPIDPTRIERDYRIGADAVVVERKLGAIGRVEGIYSPSTPRLNSVGAGYLHGNVRGADYSLLLGRFRGDDAIGVDVATSIGGLGLRGELTATRSLSDEKYARVLFGGDYGFANSFTLTVETYYNGHGTSDPARYDLPGVLAGRILNVARRYGGIGETYEVTPLVKVAAYEIMNLGDGSAVLWPRVEWSARTDLDLAVGVQFFAGGRRTEYGRLYNVAYGEIRAFF